MKLVKYFIVSGLITFGVLILLFLYIPQLETAMHTAIKYSRSSADENALSDIKEYLNDTQLTILEEVARDVELGNQDIDHL